MRRGAGRWPGRDSPQETLEGPASSACGSLGAGASILCRSAPQTEAQACLQIWIHVDAGCSRLGQAGEAPLAAPYACSGCCRCHPCCPQPKDRAKKTRHTTGTYPPHAFTLLPPACPHLHPTTGATSTPIWRDWSLPPFTHSGLWETSTRARRQGG